MAQQSLLELLNANKGNSKSAPSPARPAAYSTQAQNSLLEQIQRYKQEKKQNSVLEIFKQAATQPNKTSSVPKPSTTGPVSIQAGPYATYHYNVSAQPAEQTYTPGQAIQGKTPAAGQRTTAQGIAAMTDAQKRRRMQELAPFVRPSVENVTPKKITDEMMLSGEIARNEEEYKALASGLSHNAFIHNAIDQGLTMGLGSAMQNVWLNQDAQSEKGLDEYKYLQSIQASRELNPTAAKWGGIAGGLLGSAALYGTVGKGAEAAANTLLGKLAPNAANSTLGKIMTAFAGQQAADTAIQTPVVALKSALEGNDAGQIVGDVLEDQMWNAVGNAGMMGFEKVIGAFKNVVRNAKNEKAVVNVLGEALNDQNRAVNIVNTLQNGGTLNAADAAAVLRAMDDTRLQSLAQVQIGGKPVENMLEEAYNKTGRPLGDLDIQTASWDLIDLSPEVRRARQQASFDMPTIVDNSPERLALRQNIADSLYQQGSFAGKIDGQEVFNGPVLQERKAYIVIGPPAAGKSSVFANALSKENGARIIDSDMAKAMLPEYDGGFGAGRVHVESSDIADDLLARAVNNGDNLVYPLVGRDTNKIRNITNNLKADGYQVELYLNELPADKAARRAVSRYASTGRFVDPQYVREIGDSPNQTYDILKQEGVFDHYVRKNNDVEFGQEPILVEDVRRIPGLLGGGQENGLLRLRGSGELPTGQTLQETGNAAQTAAADATAGQIGAPFGPNTVGAAEGAFKNADDYIERYGALPKGKQQPRARDIDLPAQTDAGKTAKFAQTMAEAGITSDEAAQNIRQAVAEGDYAFVPISNKRTWQNAMETYEDRGPKEALTQFQEAVRSGTINSKTVALGEYLYKKAADAGDMEALGQIAPDLALAFTEAGRTMQFSQMLKRLTPEGNLLYVQKAVNRINEGLKNRGLELLEVTDAMKQTILQETTQEGLEQAVRRVTEQLGEQMPHTWIDKINEWRYFSMLGNPRTHIRNVIGNAVFVPVRTLKNAIGAGAENITNRVLQAFGKDPIERTKTLVRADDATKAFAMEDWLKNKDALMDGGKFNVQTAIRNSSSAFDNQFMKWLTKGNGNLLEAEDGWFLRNAYRDSLEQYLTVNKLTPEFLRSGSKAASEALQKAQNYAAQEAYKATYRDASMLADWLNNIKKKSPAAKLALDAVEPFIKTPINIIKRGVEYSPAGLLNTLTRGIKQLKNADITPAQFIDSLSSGLTGSALVAVGAWLASMGLISGAQDDTRKANNYDRTLGAQEYSLNIGDWSYTIDWMAPTILPVMVGVELFNEQQQEGESTGNALENILSAVTNVSDPVFNLSMLQGVMQAIQSFQSNPAAAAADLLGNSAQSYVNQFVPTLFGQVARTIDPTRRSTSGDPNSPLGKGVDSTLRGFAAKIPGASFSLEPYLDQWGREQQQNPAADNPMLSFALNAFSPGYLRQNNETPVDEEINRLREATGEQSVIPSYASRYYTIDGVKTDLSPSDYTTYQRTKGQTAYNAIEQMLDNSGYKQLSDTEKAKVIEKVYDYSNELAKAKVDSGYLPDKWVQNAQEASRAGIPISTYLVSRQVINEMRADKDAQGKTIAGSKKQKVFQYINSLPLTAKQKEKLFGYYY